MEIIGEIIVTRILESHHKLMKLSLNGTNSTSVIYIFFFCKSMYNILNNKEKV